MEIVTKNDLENFRLRLIADIEQLLKKNIQKSEEKLEGYKTADARKILNCSANKLVSLRVARKIRSKKIGGTIYYNKADIKILLEEGY
ncbi:MAG: helix-turn-helix domain-containing protein [Agriterribacter sp.]